MGADAPRAAHLAPLILDPVAEAVAVARRYVRRAVASLGCPELEEAATLGVSELVTNAALHARTPITVAVVRAGTGRVRVQVTDRSPVVPSQRRYGATATTGRGLRLVESASRAWGVDRHESEAYGGKTVWFEPVEEMTAAGFSSEDWAADVDLLS